MRCSQCREEASERDRFCLHCGAPLGTDQGSVTGLSLQAGASSEGENASLSSDKGSTSMLSPQSKQVPRESPVRPSPSPSWQPDSRQVERWMRGEVDLDELLSVGSDEPWGVIQERLTKLREAANRWEQHPTNADLQRLGQQTLRKLAEVQQYCREEADFRAYVEKVRSERQVKRCYERLEALTRDGALQVHEWETLVQEARQGGLAEERLRRIVEEWVEAHPNVRIGVRIRGRLLMTPREVKEVWEREGPGWIDEIDVDVMTRWIQECVGDEKSAELWRRGQVGALMWKWGSQVYWLEGHAISSLRDWVEGIYRGELEKASLAQLMTEKGREELATWLEEVHHRGDLSQRLREVGESPLWTLWEVVWATGVQPDPELAYQGTARLVKEDPTFLDAQFHHIVHCAQTQRYEEVREWSEKLLETADEKGATLYYFDQLRKTLSEFPILESYVRSLLQKYSSLIAAQPFKFRQGQANNLIELAQLCDRFPEEAATYLREGRFERWLDSRGEAYLAQEAKQTTERYRENPRQALEMFVRAIYRYEGREAEGQPCLRVEPTEIRWESMPVGAVVQKQIQLLNEGRGTAWGSIRVEGSTQDLQWTSAFAEVPVTVNMKLDTARYQPGDYEATLVIEPDGLSPIRVPITWKVVPLNVAVTPSRVEFGRVSGGRVESVIRLECQTPGGRILVDNVQVEPSLPGFWVEASGEKLGAAVRLGWNTNALEPGRTYRTHVQIVTNVGTFTVPVSVFRELPWAKVGFQAAGVGLAVGGLLLIVRQWAFLDIWTWDTDLKAFLTPGEWETLPEAALIRVGLLGASILAPIGIRFWRSKRSKKA